MESNYLIKVTYYNEHLDEDEDHEGYAVIVAKSYAEAIQILQEDLNCTIINAEVRECVLTDRIVWISEEEYDGKLTDELGIDSNKDEESEED